MLGPSDDSAAPAASGVNLTTMAACGRSRDWLWTSAMSEAAASRDSPAVVSIALPRAPSALASTTVINTLTMNARALAARMLRCCRRASRPKLQLANGERLYAEDRCRSRELGARDHRDDELCSRAHHYGGAEASHHRGLEAALHH